MTGLDSVRQAMADYLTQRGIMAVCAWPEEKRVLDPRPVVAVSVRQCESGPGGFRDYLGERRNPETGAWEELYGRRLRLCFGLDLYAPRTAGAAGVEALFDSLAGAFGQGGPEGLAVREISRGETEYDREAGLYKCAAQARCEAWLYAVADEGGAFLDFEVRGRRKL